MNRRILIITIFLIFSLLLLLFLNLATGSVSFGLDEVAGALWGGESGAKSAAIIRELRMPRALAAALLGGSLAVSGFLMQTFFRNPIAGPYILGVSAGAKLALAVLMIAFLSRGFRMYSGLMILAAFVGSLLSLGFVLLASTRTRSNAALIICGVMIGYICSAITELLIAFASDAEIANLHNWSMGSFSGISVENVRSIFFVVMVSLLATLFLAKPMSAFQMGEDFAGSVGVRIRLFRVGLLLLSGLLSAVCTAFAGPVSFVGIAVPHLVSGATGTTKPLVMIGESFLGGAVFCLFCDLLARNLAAPTELSISSVTAVFGAPVVIVMLLRNRNGNRI